MTLDLDRETGNRVECPNHGAEAWCSRCGGPDGDRVVSETFGDQFATVSRIIRTIRTWTPNARKMLSAAMGAEFPDDANRTAHLLAVSERKRKAQRRELRRLNVHLFHARAVAENRFDRSASAQARDQAENAMLRRIVGRIRAAVGASWDNDELVEEVRKRCRTE